MRGMKLFCSLMLLTVIVSCSSMKGKDSVKDGGSKIISDTSSVELYSFDEKDTSLMIMDYQYFQYDPLTGKSSLNYQDSVNQKVVDFINNSTSMESMDNSIKISEQFFEKSINKMADYYRVDLYDSGQSIWHYEASVKINNDFKDFSQLSCWTWSYTGGAHGNGFSSYFLTDKIDGRALKTVDFITDTSELNKIGEEFFREAVNISKDTDLAEEGFWFDENKFGFTDIFFFNDEGINFFFNTYEIASYVDGPLTVTIPIERVKHLLKRTLK